MADNNNVVAAGGDGGEGIPQPPENDSDTTYVDTEIEEVTPNKPNEKKFSIKFNNFEELPSEKGHEVRSSIFSCFGYEWRLQICPGGDEEALDGMVGVFLELASKGKNLKIQYSFEIKGPHDLVTRQTTNDCELYARQAWGWDNCISRAELKDDDYLEEGALTIYVSIQLGEFIPNNPASSIMLKLFGDESSADVVFEVSEHKASENESKSRSRKRAKISSANFHAHRLILQHHSPELAALCATSEGMTPILINDVKSDVFRHLLYYVYGGKISEEEFKTYAKDLINAADKYGVTNLKLAAEVWFVHHTELTVENVIDNLLYADAMNCALLKETVMDFIVKNKEEVMETVSFQDVPGNVCKDLLAAVTRRDNESKDKSGKEEKKNEETDGEDLQALRIGELRQKVQEKGLEIDGSRDALIA
ncbi:hypothetical protein ACHAWC_001393, partial [Mediolabrus comicus]